MHADVVEFIDGNQAVVKNLDPEPIDSKSKGSVRTNQNLVIALQE